MEAAGVELFFRDENKEVIEKLGTPQTLNPHKWAFHCTRIAHTKGATLAAPRTQKVIHDPSASWEFWGVTGTHFFTFCCAEQSSV